MFDQAMILSGEITCLSLLGLKELTRASPHYGQFSSGLGSMYILSKITQLIQTIFMVLMVSTLKGFDYI